MSVSPIENLGSSLVAPDKTQTSPDALRRAAEQFESILLMQLTSAMNTKNDDSDSGEENLFGADSGTNLAKQMFSEQLATTMAQSGGVGLANLIMQKFGGASATKTSTKNTSLAAAMTAVRDIKQNAPLKNLRDANTGLPLINRSAKQPPIPTTTFTGDPNDAEVISTYADETKGSDRYDSYKPLTLDGQVLNSTRPRIVPNYALAPNENAVESVSTNSISGSTNSVSTAPVSIANSTEKVEFQMPANGRISSGFGTRFHPIDHKMKFHGGLDIAIPKGTPVGAAAAGTVKFAGWKGGYGNAVIIQHADGSETLYGHNEKLLVVEGQQVNAGEKISLSGSTGKSTGPHLHFEVRENGQLVDPQKYLSKVLPKTADR